jgi:hypothetical protein
MNYESVFMMQMRELQQQCYSKFSEESWNTALKWTAAINVLLKLQQNSVNLTCMGPDMCYIIKYTTLSDGTCTDLHSYSTFCYCSHSWATKLITGVSHLGISFEILVTIIFCVFWGVFIAEEVDRVEDKGSRDTTIFMYRHSQRHFQYIPGICLFY